MPDLHRFLRSHRKSAGLTQEDVATKIGIKFNTLSDWERGRSDVGLKDLEKLAAVYGVSPVALLMAPEDGPRAEAIRIAADLAATREPQAVDQWLSTGRHLPKAE